MSGRSVRRYGAYKMISISPATRQKLETYCAAFGIGDVDREAERILKESLDTLAHEDLTTYQPPEAP